MCVDVDQKQLTIAFPFDRPHHWSTASDRASLVALRQPIADTDLTLDTIPDLPQNRTAHCRENLRAALALADDLRKQRAKTAAAILGRKGGSTTAKKLDRTTIARWLRRAKLGVVEGRRNQLAVKDFLWVRGGIWMASGIITFAVFDASSGLPYSFQHSSHTCDGGWDYRSRVGLVRIATVLRVTMFEAYYQLSKAPLLPWVKAVLTLWIVTIPVTLPFVPLSAMAAEAGDHWYVNVFVWSAFTYPLSVLTAFVFRRKSPALVVLPCVNIGLWFFAGWFGAH